MTTFINNNFDVLAKASYAAGMACGVTVGCSGEFLNNALLTVSSGVARAASTMGFYNPLTRECLFSISEHAHVGDEQKEAIQRKIELIKAKMNASHILWSAGFGFSHGIALGGAGASPSLLWGAIHGASLFALGGYAELIPLYALSKPLSLNFNRDGELESIR